MSKKTCSIHSNFLRLNFSLVAFYLLGSLFLTACGAQFQTIDTNTPTTSNPFEAEQFAVNLDKPSEEDAQLVASFCNSDDLNGFTTAKKKDFVCALLPGTIRMSKQVYKQRLQVQALQVKSLSTALSNDEANWLDRIKSDYGVEDMASMQDLLARVDIVPLPLIIAQAAIESGWGTSRAAIQGNNLFGIHGSFGKDQCLTALNNKKVCIKKYSSRVEGVSDYIQFLNTKKSSEFFRKRRAEFRSSQTPLDPLQLAATLNLYSETGITYTKYLQKMIVDQNFLRFVFIERKP